MDKYIIEELVSLPNLELFILYYDIKTPENPIYTLVDGRPIVNIYCKEFRDKII